MGRLADKVAFITGGARGIGQAMAERLSVEGADIVVCDISSFPDFAEVSVASEGDMEKTVAAVEGNGRRCVAVTADVRDGGALDRCVQEGLSALGKIDVCIPNAGVAIYKPLWEYSEEEWWTQIDVHLNGAWRTVKAIAPHMIARSEGSIVFMASTRAIEGHWNHAAYIAAKHGVIGLMRATALELGQYGVRANAILPGTIDTPGNDKLMDQLVGRPGTTREEFLSTVSHWTALRGKSALPPKAVADAVVWLASEEASHVTGSLITIDAGHSVLPGYNPEPA